MNLQKRLFIFSILAGLNFSAIAQTDSIKTIYTRLDTMIYYNVNLAAGSGKDCNHFDTKTRQIKYYVNCKEVSKEVYDKYENANSKLESCTPCYLESLDENGKLLTAGVQYTDCVVGAWTEYYPDGKIKVMGHYKENDSGNWNNIWQRGYCSVREGNWTYYDENGNVTKTENYKNNVPVQ